MPEQPRIRRKRLKDEFITLSHGAGGKASASLVEEVFLAGYANEKLSKLEDAAIITGDFSALAMSTDSFVVRPIDFPGGSLGELAINGTVNDLAASGAKAIGLSAGFILEEGTPIAVLVDQVGKMAKAAEIAGVSIISGDTKVVERGKGDGIFITTAGIGQVVLGGLSPRNCSPGDKVICSSGIGGHGISVLLARGELEISSDVVSDTRSLFPLVDVLSSRIDHGVHAMRDATRGGVATTLNELALASGVQILIYEKSVPIAPSVRGACEILGIDPLHVANEGVMIAIVDPDVADHVVEQWSKVVGFGEACVIGEVSSGGPRVLMRTAIGGVRVLDMLVGDPLPRIC